MLLHYLLAISGNEKVDIQASFASDQIYFKSPFPILNHLSINISWISGNSIGNTLLEIKLTIGEFQSET